MAILLISVSVSPCVFAAGTFNLSYSLVEGGYNLELSPANPYKGVKLEITSDVSQRYEIIQTFIKPLESRDKPGLVISDNFVIRGLRGTNKFGDFRVSAADAPVRSDEVVYISNPAGDADSFTLVYGIARPEEIEAGDYFGRISFTLSPIGSTREQVTKIIDVYVNIEKTGEIPPDIAISTPGGAKNIVLNYQKEEMRSADILVKINGKFKKPFSINQVLTQPLESQEGNRLEPAAVTFLVKEAKKGMAVNKNTPLSGGPQSIYVSTSTGGADEYFVISYNLGDLAKQKAGGYRSKIQYLLEEQGAQTKLESIELEIENERIFDLSITPEEQRYSIEFRQVKPTEPARQSAVTLEIMTNIGKRYQVNQEVYSALANKEGNVIPSQYFTLQGESLETKGKLKLLDRQEVKKGSTVLFISDDQGSPDKFKLIYELKCPQDLQAGDYTCKITYSLSEI